MKRHLLRLALVLLLAFTAGGLAWLDTAAAGTTVGECHDANSLHEHDDADDHCVHSATRARAEKELAAQKLPQRLPALIPIIDLRAARPAPVRDNHRRALRDARPLEPPQLYALSVTRLLI